MKRGEVWQVSLPAVAGREQGGQRPCVVIQDTAYGQRSPLVLIIPLSSQIGALRFPATVQIAPSAENGLSLPSVALVFQTRAADRSRFVQRLGALSAADLAAVLAELNKLTGQ
ncbi:MAG: type II toxin-antitoxin system PemK/MazF family toxin [Armatimonadetes bacterium]|nr:type II toxin-antitoxin system PemK/MazF family toxin [Armatimonadota bacterium]